MAARVQIEITARGAEEAASAFRKIAAAGEGAGEKLRRVLEIATGFNLANIFESVARGAKDAVVDLVKLGLETQRQEQAFARMTASLGVNGAALEQALEKASRGIADVSDVMTTAAQALQEGLNPEQLVKVMEIATAQSQLMGTTVTESFNQISRAILSQQERGLKTAGIYIDLTTVFAEYAAKLGVTTDRLTEYAKTQAIVEAVDRATVESRKALTTATLTNAQAVEKLQTAMQNFWEEIGKNLVDIGAGFARSIIPAVNSFVAGLKAADDLLVRITSYLPFVSAGLVNSQRALRLGPEVAAGEAGPGAFNLANLGKLGTPPPLIKPSDAKDIAKAADALAGFRQKLVELSIADTTAKQLMGVRQEVEKLAKADPASAGTLRAIGVAMEDVIVHGAQASAALKALEEDWKAATDPLAPAAERAALALGSFDAALSVTGDLGQAYRRTLGDVTFGLGGVGAALVDIVDVQNQAKESAEDLIEVYKQFGPIRTEAQKDSQDFANALQSIDVQARILGSDFDVLGARVSASQAHWNSAVTAFGEGRITLDELTASGGRFRAALADQSLYRSIESGFLSITDTFTKMADGLIQGTLDIGDAFANLGRNLLTNFVQLVIHQVFDPLLKEAAGFVAGLIGLLTGRGGGSLGAFASVGGGLLGMLGGGGNLSTTQVAALMGGGGASFGASGGGGDLLGTLGSVGSLLGTVYQVGQWALGSSMLNIVELPSLLTLASSGVKALGTALGLLGPSLSVAEVGALGLAAAAGVLTPAITAANVAALATPSVAAALGIAEVAPVVAGAAGAAAGAGGFLGAIGPYAMASLPMLVMLMPLLGELLTIAEREQISFNNRQRAIQQEGFTNEVTGRQAQVLSGQMGLDDSWIRGDLAVLGTFAKEMKDTLGSEDNAFLGVSPETLASLPRFLEQIAVLGIEPMARPSGEEQRRFGAVDPLGKLSNAQDIIKTYVDFFETIDLTALGAAAAPPPPPFDKEALINELMADLPRIALILDLPALAREGETTADTFQRMVTALSGLQNQMEFLGVQARALTGDVDIPLQLSVNLGKVAAAMDAANIAMQTTGDPEKIQAAAQQMEALIKQRAAMALEAVDALLGMLHAQAASLTSGFAALAQSAPILKDLGIEVRGMGDAVADVIDLLGEVGDAAGQLQALGPLGATHAASVSGAGPAEILASTQQALARGLSSTVATVNALTNAQERMAGLTQALGTLTAGYQASMDALTAHFDTLRAAEEELYASRRGVLQAEIDRAADLVRAYYGAQQDALRLILEGSREWAGVALSIRDQLRGLEQGPTSPLNPADQLALAQGEFAGAQAAFAATPTADLAHMVAELGQGVIDAAGQVFSRPSPAYETLFNEVTGVLRGVATTAEARVTPEQQILGLIEDVDDLLTTALGDLGIEVDASTAALKALGLEAGDAKISLEAISTLAKGGGLTAETFDQLFTAANTGAATSIVDQSQMARDILNAGRIADGTWTSIVGVQAEAVYQSGVLNGISGTLVGLPNALAEALGKGTDAKTALDTLTKDHEATLTGLVTAETAAKQALAGALSAVAGNITGVTGALGTSGALWIATHGAATGIVGSITVLNTELHETRGELAKILNDKTIADHIKTKTDEMAADLDALGGAINKSLEDLVGARIQKLIDEGGPDAVANALKGLPIEQVARNTLNMAQNIYQLGHIASGNSASIQWLQIPQAHTGMWDVPREMPVLLAPHERVLDPDDAEQSRRYGIAGPASYSAPSSVAVAERGGAPVTLNIAPGAIVISGVSDPEKAADLAVQKLKRLIGNAGGHVKGLR